MKTGIIGWRGMVGSVLLERMKLNNDFAKIEPIFFTTSQAGQPAPDFGQSEKTLIDAHKIEYLSEMDAIISCQGGSYTESIHPKLRNTGWNGYWIDAASTLRMKDNATIILDPINRNVIDKAIEMGKRDFIGGNCTVSLMLMAIGGLIKADHVSWISSMTYQAASGAGANNMRELLTQMGHIHKSVIKEVNDPSHSILDIDRKVSSSIRSSDMPINEFGAPLAGSIIPWIDRLVEDGQTREEWKGQAETNKILGSNPIIPIDGICVRIGAMRSHSQALTIKLNKDIPIKDIEQIIIKDNEWVDIIDNNRDCSLEKLTPASISGTLQIPVGRLRKMKMGKQYLSAFTVGDQLLWGAAEPLRRMLQIILNK